MITAHGSIDNAITAMKKGAADYLEKPVNFDELFLRLEKVQNLKHLLKNAIDLREAMEVTEQTSGETIQNLEMTVADLESRLDNMRGILSRQDLPAQHRILKALEWLIRHPIACSGPFACFPYGSGHFWFQLPLAHNPSF